jgi:hypothetical protein
MKTMNTFTRNLVGAAAVGAMALSSVTPALARGSHGDGIGAGEVIAGALIIGGIAAIAASSGNRDRGDYAYDRAGYRDGRDDYRDGRFGYGEGFGNPRGAVEKCVRAAERSASRYSRGNADVTDIRSVRDTRDGYRIKGRIAVNSNARAWRAGDRQYGNGWNGDYRGWNSGMRGYDSGTFDCRVSRGRVVNLDFNGIRGL